MRNCSGVHLLQTLRLTITIDHCNVATAARHSAGVAATVAGPSQAERMGPQEAVLATQLIGHQHQRGKTHQDEISGRSRPLVRHYPQFAYRKQPSVGCSNSRQQHRRRLWRALHVFVDQLRGIQARQSWGVLARNYEGGRCTPSQGTIVSRRMMVRCSIATHSSDIRCSRHRRGVDLDGGSSDRQQANQHSQYQYGNAHRILRLNRSSHPCRLPTRTPRPCPRSNCSKYPSRTSSVIPRKQVTFRLALRPPFCAQAVPRHRQFASASCDL
jgi:hypothetical protein